MSDLPAVRPHGFNRKPGGKVIGRRVIFFGDDQAPTRIEVHDKGLVIYKNDGLPSIPDLFGAIKCAWEEISDVESGILDDVACSVRKAGHLSSEMFLREDGTYDEAAFAGDEALQLFGESTFSREWKLALECLQVSEDAALATALRAIDTPMRLQEMSMELVPAAEDIVHHWGSDSDTIAEAAGVFTKALMEAAAAKEA